MSLPRPFRGFRFPAEVILWAVLMWEQDPKAFEVWCVGELDGLPNDKKGADRGIDGRIPFKPDGKRTQFAVVSVKGGKLQTDDVRALSMVGQREKASSLGFGVLVSTQGPTAGMRADAAAAGSATFNGRRYPLIQCLTVEEMLQGKRPNLPLVDAGVSYAHKRAKAVTGQQDNLL